MPGPSNKVARVFANPSLHYPFRRALALAAACVLAGVVAATPAAASPDGQWYVDALHLHQAQQVSTGKGVTVAVIDSGIDKTRPALKGRVLPGKCFGSAEVLKPTWDNVGHGTKVAGLLAGSGTDRRHILGVAPGATLMPLCVTGDDVTSQSLFESITPAIRYAADHGAGVISMALGADEKRASDRTVKKLHAAIAYAEQHDVVLVAAAGNASEDEATLSPANLPGVIAATGSNAQGGAWKDSIPGKHVGLAAPANNLLTLNTHETEDIDHGPRETSGYATVSGTSAATALVAGAAALVRSKYPKLDAANVVHRLTATATDKGPHGRDDTFGYGIVDPAKAVTADVDTVESNPLGQLAAQSSTPHEDASSPSREAAGIGSDSSGTWVVVLLAAVVLVGGGIVAVALARRRRLTGPTKHG